MNIFANMNKRERFLLTVTAAVFGVLLNFYVIKFFLSNRADLTRQLAATKAKIETFKKRLRGRVGNDEILTQFRGDTPTESIWCGSDRGESRRRSCHRGLPLFATRIARRSLWLQIAT